MAFTGKSAELLGGAAGEDQNNLRLMKEVGEHQVIVSRIEKISHLG
jgi:hypothetical protein